MRRALALALVLAVASTACGDEDVAVDLPIVRPPARSIVCEGDGAVTEQCARDAAARRGGKVAWLPGDGILAVIRTEAHQTVVAGDKVVLVATDPSDPGRGEEAAPIDGRRHVVSRVEGDVVSEHLEWTEGGVTIRLTVMSRNLADEPRTEWLRELLPKVRIT